MKKNLLKIIGVLAAVFSLAMPAAAQESTNTIVRAEYFIDSDPGEGAGTVLTGSFGGLDVTLSADITVPVTLPIGPHKLFVRMQGTNGIWSNARWQYISVTGDKHVTAAEYFVDLNPNVNTNAVGTVMTPVDGSWGGLDEAVQALEIPTDSLSVGLHTIYVRGKDQDNQWGPARSYTFQVLAKPTVAAADYLVGPVGATNDPAADWKSLISVLPTDFTMDLVSVQADLDTTALPRGQYRVWVRGKDSVGRVTSDQPYATFEVLKTLPQLAVMSDQMVRPGASFSFRVGVVNGVAGAFSLAAGAPAGMTIDPTTGLINWTPAAGDAGSKTVTVVFKDGGTPALDMTRTFNLVVESADAIAPLTIDSVLAVRGSAQASLVFSKPLDGATATDPANYTLNGTHPNSVLLRADGRTVVLSSPVVSGGDFELAVSGVQDALGTAIAGPAAKTGTIAPLRSKSIGSDVPPLAGVVFPLRESGAEDDVELAGMGIGFGGSADAGTFAYEVLPGDFEVRARLEAFDIADYLSAAGLVARESLDPAARSVSVLARPVADGTIGTDPIVGSAVLTFSRSVAAQNATVLPGTAAHLTAPWMKISRIGSTISTFYSTNGVDWTKLADVTDVWPDKLYVGLAAASGAADGPAANARFRKYGPTRPTIVNQPSAQASPLGSTVTFGVTARGADTLNYQWLHNGNPIAGATSNSFRINAITLADMGKYSVSVVNSYGSANSAQVNLDLGGTIGGRKGDVAPRPGGDNNVSVADFVQTARFVAGLDTPSASEVYRADTAPKASGGNGVIDGTDLVQTALYVVGLSAKPNLALAAVGSSAPRSVEIGSVPAGGKGLVEAPVLIKGAGGENTITFSVEFLPSLLRFKGFRTADAFTGAFTLTNSTAAASGHVGILLALPATKGLAPGANRICWLQFEVLASVNSAASITVSDEPIQREVVDAMASELPATFSSGAVTVSDATNAVVVQTTDGGRLELVFPASIGARYSVESSEDLVSWLKYAERQAAGLTERVELPDVTAAPYRFYRVMPLQ